MKNNIITTNREKDRRKVKISYNAVQNYTQNLLQKMEKNKRQNYMEEEKAGKH